MADTTNLPEESSAQGGLSRRQFIKGMGAVGVIAALGATAVDFFMLGDEVMALPVSGGYLLVDTKKCSGCSTCMMACSLAHFGETGHSLSRIQITQNPYAKFPEDITPVQCRQCDECANACPTGAMHVDPSTGVRTVDEVKCIGCLKCVAACPQTVSAVQWNPDEHHSQKCDLCMDTPYLDGPGGPEGTRACESVCPMRAIKFTTQLPETEAGYSPNLRNENWATFGYADI